MDSSSWRSAWSFLRSRMMARIALVSKPFRPYVNVSPISHAFHSPQPKYRNGFHLGTISPRDTDIGYTCHWMSEKALLPLPAVRQTDVRERASDRQSTLSST